MKTTAQQDYEDKLLDDRWVLKRRLILARDQYTCRHCKSQNELQVHHLVYIAGREPWQYRSGDLTTLCDACHDEVHQTSGVKYQIQRGERATAYPYQFNSLAEVIANAIG
jgi:5-methylcytosine-specific restriction endonuclease McrA